VSIASPSPFESSLADRRWYPVDRPEQWAVTTRSRMWNSIRECVERAIGASVPLGATPAELEGSDTVFHDLCECAQSAATAVGALGQTDDGAVAMVLAAAVKAAEPAVLHSAVLGAIEQWCREALAPQGPLVPAAAFPVAHSPAVATEWPHPRQQPAGEAAHAIEAFFGMAEGHPEPRRRERHSASVCRRLAHARPRAARRGRPRAACHRCATPRERGLPSLRPLTAPDSPWRSADAAAV